MITLYDFPLSGNAHKVRLLLSLLKVEYERKEVALAKGEQNSAEFLALNPFHHVPVLVDGDIVIRDSSAILLYLARKYSPEWAPSDPTAAAKVQEWLAVSSKEVAEGPGAARLVNLFGATLDKEQAIANSHALFNILDAHLSDKPWVANDTISIADIALYSYIAHAPEGDVSLDAYANIKNWLTAIEALPGFVGMPKSPVGLNA